MATLNELIETLSETPVPTRRGMGHMLRWWLLASLLYVSFLLLCFGLRDDIGMKLAVPMFLAELGVLVLIIVTTGFSAMALSYPDMHQMPGLVFAPLVPLGLFVILLYGSWIMDKSVAPEGQHGMECTICITLYSLLPAWAMFYLLRRQASTHLYATGAVTALNAFSLGCLALRLSEETDSADHLIRWHYLPMIGSTLAGLGMGRLILKW